MKAVKRSKSEKKSGILGFIETVGNKLPHPATIFVILCAWCSNFISCFSIKGCICYI